MGGNDQPVWCFGQEARSRFEEDKVRILKEVKKIARSYNRADSIIRGAIVGAAWGAWLPEVQAAAMGDIKILQVKTQSQAISRPSPITL